MKLLLVNPIYSQWLVARPRFFFFTPDSHDLQLPMDTVMCARVVTVSLGTNTPYDSLCAVLNPQDRSIVPSSPCFSELTTWLLWSNSLNWTKVA